MQTKLKNGHYDNAPELITTVRGYHDLWAALTKNKPVDQNQKVNPPDLLDTQKTTFSRNNNSFKRYIRGCDVYQSVPFKWSSLIEETHLQYNRCSNYDPLFDFSSCFHLDYQGIITPGSPSASVVYLPCCISVTGCASLTLPGWRNAHGHWLLVWLCTPKWQCTVRPFWLRQQLCFQSKNCQTKTLLSCGWHKWSSYKVQMSQRRSLKPYKLYHLAVKHQHLLIWNIQIWNNQSKEKKCTSVLNFTDHLLPLISLDFSFQVKQNNLKTSRFIDQAFIVNV